MNSIVGQACIINTKPNTVYSQYNRCTGLIVSYSPSYGQYSVLVFPKEFDIRNNLGNSLSKHVMAFKPYEIRVIQSNL